ncbi:hypothetical protein IQ06DRAFT_116646 [Phaeosphaeriaceae sp. SRC1lsM3a]|nr:hypothetical protein IQ06DRAFT_116646 [Stagonospora sp. SRC1lsM3a]
MRRTTPGRCHWLSRLTSRKRAEDTCGGRWGDVCGWRIYDIAISSLCILCSSSRGIDLFPSLNQLFYFLVPCYIRLWRLLNGEG